MTDCPLCHKSLQVRQIFDSSHARLRCECGFEIVAHGKYEPNEVRPQTKPLNLSATRLALTLHCPYCLKPLILKENIEWAKMARYKCNLCPFEIVQCVAR